MTLYIPTGDKILIRPVAVQEKTEGGIYLPDKAKEEKAEGEVIAVGPGRIIESGGREPNMVQVGDHVIFSKFGGDEVTLNGEKFKVVRETEILLIIR